MMCGPFLSVQCFIALYRCPHFRSVSHPVVCSLFSRLIHQLATPASNPLCNGTAKNTVSLNWREAVNLVRCIPRDQTIFPSQLRKGCSPTDSLPTLWQTCTCLVRVSLMNVVFLAKFQVSKWEWVGRNFSRCNYTQISVKPHKSFPIRER